MIQRIQSMKNKKGFTLVELIVVLVILVILAAIAVPSFTQYITKAKEQQDSVEANAVLTATKSVASFSFGDDTTYTTDDDFVDAIASYAEGIDKTKITASYDDSDGSFTLEYAGNVYTYEYNTSTKQWDTPTRN